MGSRQFLIAGVIVALIAIVGPGTGWAACRDDAVSLKGDWGSARFSVDVADTAAERSQGLMFVDSMPRSKGMLFVYDRPQRVAFWMRNTLIPLDMVFADARGVVQRVHVNAIPGDETSIPGGEGIQFVLEINGGMSEVLGITPGSLMQHPAISDAAWPCAALEN